MEWVPTAILRGNNPQDRMSMSFGIGVAGPFGPRHIKSFRPNNSGSLAMFAAIRRADGVIE